MLYLRQFNWRKDKGQFYSHRNVLTGHLHWQSPINKSFPTFQYIYMSKAGGRIRYIQLTIFNPMVCAGSRSDLSVCHVLKLRFPNINRRVLDAFAIPNILIYSHVLQETPERKESTFDCQNGSRELCTHTYTHSLNLFHTSHSSRREKTGSQSEGDLNSWQINTGWWIQLPK